MTDTPDIELVELRGLLAKATPGPWAYRPQELDDWGIIRTVAAKNGPHPVVARANSALSIAEINAARQSGADPSADNAALIVATVNALPALLAELERLAADIAARDADWRAWLAREGISYDKGPDGLPKGWGKSALSPDEGAPE